MGRFNVEKKVVLIDIYCCCDCIYGKMHNIKCASVRRRDDAPVGSVEVPKPVPPQFCPMDSKHCNWTYASTERKVVVV